MIYVQCRVGHITVGLYRKCLCVFIFNHSLFYLLFFKQVFYIYFNISIYVCLYMCPSPIVS